MDVEDDAEFEAIKRRMRRPQPVPEWLASVGSNLARFQSQLTIVQEGLTKVNEQIEHFEGPKAPPQAPPRPGFAVDCLRRIVEFSGVVELCTLPLVAPEWREAASHAPAGVWRRACLERYGVRDKRGRTWKRTCREIEAELGQAARTVRDLDFANCPSDVAPSRWRDVHTALSRLADSLATPASRRKVPAVTKGVCVPLLDHELLGGAAAMCLGNLVALGTPVQPLIDKCRPALRQSLDHGDLDAARLLVLLWRPEIACLDQRLCADASPVRRVVQTLLRPVGGPAPQLGGAWRGQSVSAASGDAGCEFHLEMQCIQPDDPRFDAQRFDDFGQEFKKPQWRVVGHGEERGKPFDLFGAIFTTDRRILRMRQQYENRHFDWTLRVPPDHLLEGHLCGFWSFRSWAENAFQGRRQLLHLWRDKED